MKRKDNKKCLCCSKVYTFCLHCSDYDHLPRWMNLFHNENCKNLFDISNDFAAGKISAEEAKEAYSKCDLRYKNKLKDFITDAMSEVNKICKKRTVKEKVEEVSKEAFKEVIEEVSEEIFEVTTEHTVE